MSSYLKLYRIDAALISLLSYIVGRLLCAGSMNMLELAIALAISLVSVNFIYSYNSYADHEIDAVNKPDRPIPSGKVSPQTAYRYAMLLLALSVIYPLFIYRSPLTLCLFWTLPVLGILYSGKAFKFKKNKYLATITTSFILVIPISLGFFMNTNNLDYLSQIIVLLFYCFAVIPLKDIEDEHGDVMHGSENWYASLGKKRLFLSSLFGLTIPFALTLLLDISQPSQLYLQLFVLGTALTILAFLMGKLNPIHLYKTIIRIVIIEGFVAFLVEYFLKNQ